MGQSRKENTIRNGSPLIVKDGQAAVFQYPQGGYDIFIDQHTTKLSTDNMPVLAGLVGTLFAGGSPCPAQIYFVNLQTSVKVPFYVPDIRLTPPSQQTYGDMNLEFSDLRVSVKGVVTMAVPRDINFPITLLQTVDATSSGSINPKSRGAEESQALQQAVTGCAAAVIDKLEKQVEAWMVKTTIYKTRPILSKVGTKEGIKNMSRFEVLEYWPARL